MQTGNPDETITSRAPAKPVQSTKPPEALLTRKELAGYISNVVNLSRWPLGGRDTCELCKSIDGRRGRGNWNAGCYGLDPAAIHGLEDEVLNVPPI